MSEIVLIDWAREGSLKNSFSDKILNILPFDFDEFIIFGGINSPSIARNLINKNNVSALIIGNYLSYKEHSIQNYKEIIKEKFIRSAKYQYLKIGYTYYDK